MTNTNETQIYFPQKEMKYLTGKPQVKELTSGSNILAELTSRICFGDISKIIDNKLNY